MRLFEDGMTLEKYQSVIYQSERERLASDTSEYEDGYDIEYSDCDYSLFPLVGPEDATPKGIVALIMLFVGDNIIKGGNIDCGYDGRKYLVMANGYAIDMREPELEFDRLADWITGYSCEETGSAGAYDLGKEYRGEEQATRDIEFFVALDNIDLDELRKEWRLANPESFAMQIDGISSYLRFGINEVKSYYDKASSTIYKMTDGMWLDVEILIGGKPIENQVPYELAYRVAMDVAGGSAQFYDWMNHDFDGLGRECYDAIIAD